MEKRINGLHHITVIASDPQKNYEFYTQVLGMRFVKKTVNFDSPDVYHLYYADETGTPGTVLTFFPFSQARRGRRGAGEASEIAFSVPEGSIPFWAEHLSAYGIPFSGPDNNQEKPAVSFLDPDGMKIVLIEDAVEHLTGWETPEIPRKYAVRKFYGFTMYLNDGEATDALLKDVLGLREISREGRSVRYISGEGDRTAIVNMIVDPGAAPATQSAGSIHHIAWRTASREEQRGWMERLSEAGYPTTESIDRNYFYSIYFREPGGVLFEIATDEPGFAVDEDQDALGTSLKLPPQYEAQREKIEKKLIPLQPEGRFVNQD